VKRLVTGLLLISLSLAMGLSLLASQAPDGLEHSLETVGADSGSNVIASPMPDYQVPGGSSETFRRVLAGLSGTLAVFGMVLLVGWFMRRAQGER